MRKNLVIVRAGDRSLHTQWINRADRSWDLAVSYYGDAPARYEGLYDLLHCCKGSKWQGVNDFILKNSELVSRYRHVWIPDDDLLTNGETIDEFFDLCEALDLTIAQPALTPYSHHSWKITLQEPGLVARITNFVEIMAPCFKGDRLRLFSQHFSENTSGWGYEWLWLKIAQAHGIERMGIVDATPIYHTRPVGTAGHGGSVDSPEHEMRRLFDKFGLQIIQPKVLMRVRADAASGFDTRAQALSPAAATA